jgi:hypothetical protein
MNTAPPFFASSYSPGQLLIRHKNLLVFYSLAIFLDALSTIYFMHRGAVEQELHPLVRWGALIYGPIVGPLLFAFLFKFLAGLVILFYLTRMAPAILRLAAFISLGAAVLNLWSDTGYLH